MSRIFSSALTSRSPPLDDDPLLPPHSSRSNSIFMANLSPRASPSPPPSFYRTANTTFNSEYSDNHKCRSATLSPSPSRTKGRQVQFAGPPPSIAASVVVPTRSARGSSRSSGTSLDGVPAEAGMGMRRGRRGSGGALDPLLGLERRERAIQRELQELLDAQSAGLVQGFGGGDERVSEAGSSTPTYNSTRSQSAGRVVPVRQPRKKALGLRGARRGLLRDIGELAGVKGEEGLIFGEAVRQRELVLEKVWVWEERIRSFRKRLEGGVVDGEVGRDEEGRELAELRSEERAVDNEIRHLEERLVQMRARKRWIQERVREGDNRREARLSSYRGALREVEGEVKDFLRRPPSFAASTSEVLSEEENFTTLPINRRTLGMARELWTREISSLRTKQEIAEAEKEALEQGAKLWAESIEQVLEFEDGLRKQMSGSLHDVEMLQNQVKKMGTITEVLGESLKTAEEKGWNLLICALGAEFEAFKEGEEILKGTLGMVESPDGSKDQEELGVKNNGLEELNGGVEGRKSIEREEGSEDDGPNLAELLIDNSH